MQTKDYQQSDCKGGKKKTLIQSGVNHIFHKNLLGLKSVSDYQHKPQHIRKHHLFHL